MTRIHSTRFLAGTVGCVLALQPRPLAAQDPLKVVRFEPDSIAAAVAPVVIRFDRPVAPRLADSVDPDSVLTISPKVGARIYWRDPSTIVAEFDAPWPSGSSYAVTLSPRTRSADGHSLGVIPPVRVRVQRSHLLYFGTLPLSANYPKEVGPSPAAVAVYSEPVTASALDRQVWLVAGKDCARSDSVAMEIVSIDTVRDSEDYYIAMAGGYDRDTRLDSLRRVVTVRAPGPYPRRCALKLRAPTEIGAAATTALEVRVRPAFSLAAIETPGTDSRDGECTRGCWGGPITLRFSSPVTRDAVERSVRIDGRAVKAAGNDPGLRWTLSDTVPMGRPLRVHIDAVLSSVYGDRLQVPVDTMIHRDRRAEELGYAEGRVLVPAGSNRLLRLRVAYADSVTVIIARVPDSLRARALMHGDHDFGRRIHWPTLASDSVVRVVPVPPSNVNERIVDVDVRWVPVEWRSDRILLVRSIPHVAPDTPPPAAPGRNRAGTGVHRLPPMEVTSIGGGYREYPRYAVVQRSDLAAHASQHGRMLDVWVTDLQSGAPVAGARVRLLERGDRVIVSGTADRLGFTQLRLSARAWTKAAAGRRYVEVSDGTRQLLLSLPRELRMDYEESLTTVDDTLPVSPSEGLLRATAFTDRGIYRPGERVFVKGIARTLHGAEGFRVPAGDSARWSLSFQGEEPIAVRNGKLSDFGSYADSFDLARTARVGAYRADFAVRDAEGWHTVASRTLAIAEYRVPEFAVSAATDTTTRTHAGDTVTIRVNGRYLFGPPMAGGQVTTTANTYPDAEQPPSLPLLRDYTVGRSYEWITLESPERGPAVARTDHLDEKGELTLRLPVAEFAGPATMRVSVNVQDVNRQTIGSSVSVPIHAADAYVGLRPTQQRWVWNAGDTIRFDLLVAGADGAVRNGTRIDLVATRLTWSERYWVRDTTWRTSVVSASTAARAAFVPSKSGWYEVIASAADERERRTESAVSVYVAGSRTPGSSLVNDITMRTDRARYAPGDTATVLIDAPLELSGLVTIGREQVLGEQLVQLHEGLNIVRVPLPLAAAPSTDIDVVAVRAMGSAQMASSPGPFALRGTTSVEVDGSSRALRVRLAPDRARYRPGDTVRVALDVRESSGAGHRSEVAVWAVDEGVRSLTGYSAPTLLDDLTASWYRWVTFASTLNAFLSGQPPSVAAVYYPITLYGMSGANAAMYLQDRVAGYAAPPNSPADRALRRRFASTPFFVGSLLTDPAGHASTSFVLPDNVTTYRLYAAAVSEGVLAGTADTTIVSTRPLIVRAALPRIVRIGDSLLAGAVLTSERTERVPVSLRIDPGALRIDGPTVLNDTIEIGRARERRFPLHASGQTDTVVVRFRATAATDDDAVEARMPVSPPGKPRARVVMGTFERTASLELELPDDFDATRSHATLQLGVSVAPLVRQLGEALRSYPYDCTEQIASLLRASLAGIRLRRAMGDSSLSDLERRQLQLGVNVLIGRQRYDGGIGYWSATHWSSLWLTSYALDALLGAREIGMRVPAGPLHQATEYLRSMTGTVGEYFARTGVLDSTNYASQALHAAVMLRRLGAADTALEQRVRDLRRRLNYQDRLVLAQLWVASGNRDEASVLLDDAWRSARIEGRRVVLEDSIASRSWIFRSVTGPATALLRATAQIDPGHALLAPLFESIVQDARSEIGRWNTIDLAAASEAIASVAEPLGVAASRDVVVSGSRGGRIAQIAVAARGSDSVAIPIDAMITRRGGGSSLRLALASASPAPTYYAMTVFEVPLARPTRADEAGISVERWYESFADGKPITSVAEGELVRVRLRISTPRDREFVVVDDALPAGLEAVDQSLRTASNLPPYVGAPRLRGDLREGPIGQRWLYGSWDGGWWTPWEHKEIRDDRVLYFARQLWRGSYQASYVARATTAGVFVRPPAQAEEMYNPAVRGRSDGGIFTVTTATPGPSHP